MGRVFEISSKVFNATQEQWNIVHEIEDENNIIVTTAKDFLDTVGIIGSCTSNMDNNEHAFFDELCNEYRELGDK